MIYRPRMACRLQVPTFADGRDDTVSIPMRIRRATVEYNDHNHADTLSVLGQWRDVGVDPRFLKNATVELWMGNADERGDFIPSDANLRFIGVMTRPRRVAKESGGFEVELELHVYTELFLAQKPFPSRGAPSFSDTLPDAWRKICDHVGPMGDDGEIQSSVSVLAERIEFRGGIDPSITLGKAVAARFAKLASVPIKANTDAWAVWQQCVGMLGLISFIDRDRCIVTTSTEHYTADTAPRMIWGQNILELEESTNAKFSDKGVAITSFDPLTGTTLEAFYPTPGDKRINRKRPAAQGKHSKPKEQPFPSDRYDFFEYHGVTEIAQLEAIARRAWEERSRQELEGSLHTAEMFAKSVSKETIDLMTLRAGDAVRVVIDPYDKEALASVGSGPERIAYLMDRGYGREVADLIVRNMKAMNALDPVFHVTRARTTLETTGDSGKFEIEIAYHNRIKLDG